MSSGTLATAQFSIYRINLEEVDHVFDLPEAENNEEYTQTVVAELINHVIEIVKKRPSSQSYRIEYSGFKGVIFKTVHKPVWDSIARQIIAGNGYEGEQTAPGNNFIENTNISYVLFYPYSGGVYAITGGYGSNYIVKFIEKNFGLYLIPKIIERNNPVVKSIIQNNLLGNQTATQKTNKKTTSISLEQDMSSIFRQLSIEADREIAKLLGIEFEENESESKKIKIVNKDSIVIHRSISISELKGLIHRLFGLEQSSDLFPLNYLVLATKKRIKNAELFENLLNVLANKEFDRFILTGDDYTAFYTGADRYVLTNEEDTVLLEQPAPFTFVDVISQIPNPKHPKSALRTMLKQWTISTFDNSGQQILYNLSVFDAIQGFIEFGESNRPCYLFNGLWYVFDEKFSRLLTQEYEEFFDLNAEPVSSLAAKFALCRSAENEDSYNKDLRANKLVTVAHTVMVDNIEIADAIFWDDNAVYLMHNKRVFSGSGARDVTNQVLTAAEYLQQRLARHDRVKFLENYYDSIHSKYLTAGYSLDVPKQDFVASLQSGKTFHYVIGYMSGYEKTSHATYAKYLTIETAKKLAAKGYRCSVLNICP